MMGSLIHLSVGKLEVDWGKNNAFNSHGDLFQPQDLAQVPYVYWDEQTEELIEQLNEGASRPLRNVMPRLALLGHSLDTAEAEFHQVETQTGKKLPISFRQLAEAMACVDVMSPIVDQNEYHDFGEFFAREIFVRLDLGSITENRHDAWDLAYAMENFSVGSVLTLLGQNPANLDCHVSWHFADVIDGGWVDRTAVHDSLGSVRQFLIVTEGTSDARIMQHGLNLLRPDVADFFTFVDMDEGYPFTGTGNLYRFCQGLVGIGIENRVVVVYDNDAEGVFRYSDTLSLKLPRNMRAIVLPENAALDEFPTDGPDGRAVSNINGRAAAIECYLDLSYKETEPPLVRWTNYRSGQKTYQGELVGKEKFTRRFLRLDNLPDNYDASGILSVLDAVISACEQIAQDDKTLRTELC